MSEPFDLNKRLLKCEEDDAVVMTGIEVSFACAVYMTQEQQSKLLNVLDEIVRHPYNQPVHGVHWLCSVGQKMIFSDADATLLGKPKSDSPLKPKNGEEPVAVEDVYSVDTAARPFVTEAERISVESQRGNR